MVGILVLLQVRSELGHTVTLITMCMQLSYLIDLTLDVGNVTGPLLDRFFLLLLVDSLLGLVYYLLLGLLVLALG